MRRRSFLYGTSTLLISQLLVGCNVSKQPQLTVQVLKGSIPGRILKQFQESLSAKAQLKFSPVVQLRELFNRLEKYHKYKTSGKKSEGFKISLPFTESQPSETDLVTLGDFWLKEAIANQLIQPLSREQLKNWSNLSSKWQELVERNSQGFVDKQGQIWAAPYRWGNTVIVYRRDKLEKFDWELQDWSDLWREELKGRISLLNQSREVIGLTLKKLGKSYNTENLQEVPSLEKELQTLSKQVKFYDSTNYLEPLIIGDTWLAVGWSNDIVSILSRYPQLSVVVPNSGTALWADLWVQPTGEVEKDLSNKWIDFCWEPHIAKEIALLTKGNSPVTTNIAASDILQPLQKLLLTNPQFDKSEFLLPLSKSSTEQYDSLFNAMKTG
ncbi:extracellular solute-binding protein [Rivularia sp. UHCC 0363]|uniref:extracellular solute-binding protein n=1 Tax=Rivularia sp. UHCC 0363 TaxID=3110244 RepID=UPI002B204EB6|nr:extracellular solute-binding protein [Rivularia sp. UHCC 0363]MEA5593683.1 extracellular solute-binding protein [Rivularia sp. UHCC 0363]